MTTLEPFAPATIVRRPAGELDPLAAIGQAYLLDQPERADVTMLLSSLGFDTPDVAAARYPSLAARIAEDFVEHQLFEADAWVVSLTEARLGALVLLTTMD